MYKLFIGIPTIRDHEGFINSFVSFRNQLLDASHEMEICRVKNRPIAEARNMIVDRFLQSDKDYLLFLDDDHTGHSMEMFKALLDPLVNNNAYICAIKCHTKVFPFASNLCVYSHVDEVAMGLPKDAGKYMPLDLDKGYVYLDLVGFGMTLISRELFSKIEPPYFVSDFRIGQGREDNYFCDKLVKVGIKPVGCFDYTLEHNGIGKHNAYQLREEGMIKLKEKYPDMKVLVS